MSELAREAYEAYGDFVNWKNVRGGPMPEWDDLPPTIRDAWEAAERVVKLMAREAAR